MKTLIVLLTLAFTPFFAQQIAAANEDNAVLQQGIQGDTHDEEFRQLLTGIGTNAAKVLGIGAFLLVLLFVATALLRWLWNITVPDVFNLKAITFWQCFRLLLISNIVLAGGGGIMRAM